MAPYTSTANETATSNTSSEIQAALILMRLCGRYTDAELEAAQGLALFHVAEVKKTPNVKISTADYVAWKKSGFKTFTEFQVKKEARIRAEAGPGEDEESSLEEGEIREVFRGRRTNL